jgi:hypothetical protein
VRISANGETKTRDFTLGIDPRLVADGISEAYLQEQFKLSLQVRDRVSAANLAVLQIRGIRDQINQRLEKVGPRRKAEIQKLADTVLNSLASVEQEVYQVKNQSSQDPLNFPIKLNNKIAALMGVIESADNRPTQQTYEVFEQLSKALDAELQKKDTTLKTDLPRLNAAFQREKLAPVNPDVKAPEKK